LPNLGSGAPTLFPNYGIDVTEIMKPALANPNAPKRPTNPTGSKKPVPKGK